MCFLGLGISHQGGSGPTPTSLQTPRSFRTAVLQFEILEKSAGAEGAKIFWGGLLSAFFFCVYTQNTRNFVEKSKMGENIKKI